MSAKVHVVVVPDPGIAELYQTTLAHCEDLRGSVRFTEISWKDADLSSKLQGADVVFGAPSILSQYMQSLSTVKWVHSTYAGVEPFMSHSHPSDPFLLTRHGGSFGAHMAEYVIAQIVNRERNYFDIRDEQKRHEWVAERQKQSYRLLHHLTIGILGVGDIGKRIAEICKSFGMTVWGLTRTPPSAESCLDHHRLMDGLPELFSSCDYICNILPSTPETRGALNGDVFRHCAKKKAVFINIGRGDVVDEASLVNAIRMGRKQSIYCRQGWLSGAILDVFPKEPLDPDSELWSLPEVVITPHVSGLGDADETAETFVTNLRLFLAGKELKYIVHWNRGY